jgi:hypothetical protein
MTSKEKFSPEEWQILAKAGTLIGHAIIISDKPRRARKEQRILRKAFRMTASNYPGNELITAILLDAEKEAKTRIVAKTLYREKEILIEGYMKELVQVGRALTKAEEKEGREFKLWLLNIGEVTALAVRDEELANIGLPGDEISKTEKKILKRVAKELGLVPYVVDMNPVHSKRPRWMRRPGSPSSNDIPQDKSKGGG